MPAQQPPLSPPADGPAAAAPYVPYPPLPAAAANPAGTPSNPYAAPSNPYAAPASPYGVPYNPYGAPSPPAARPMFPGSPVPAGPPAELPRPFPPLDPAGPPPPDVPFASGWEQPQGLAGPPSLEDSLFRPGQIIAWVGDLPIQSGDLMPMVEQMLAPGLAKLTPEQLRAAEDEIEEQKQKLLQQALEGAIDTKLLYLDFLRSIPQDKKKEILPQITKRAEEQFYEKQLPEAIEKAKVVSAIELDAQLRKYGTSVAEQKRMFIERILGQSTLGQKIKYNPEVTHQEMLDYYHENSTEFDRQARARWEKLTVRYERFPSKAEAWEALGQMGNEVLRGAPLPAVAQRSSQGPDAQDGGFHDWTTKGSLASPKLDEAVFSLPPGRLSDRLDDEQGFHIVRVLEREEAGRVPFVEAQVEIKEKIRKNKTRKQIEEYVAQLRKQTPVWTAFDGQKPADPARSGNSGSSPPAANVAAPAVATVSTPS